MRLRKLVTISLPAPLLKEAEKVAKEEYRNMSELFREALRFYIVSARKPRNSVNLNGECRLLSGEDSSSY